MSFTKGEVNRAGKLARELMTMPGPTTDAIEALGPWKVVDAFYAITWWRSLHARPLSSVAAGLRYHVAKEGGLVNGRTDVTQRLKRRNTIIDKLTREPTMEVTQFHDIGGVRALLPSLTHVYAVSRRLRKTWTVVRIRDYIANPKPSGYRALHLIVRRDDYAIEVQLRTIRQDAWANQVEDDGRQIGVGLKFGAGATDIHDYYVAMSEAFAYLDRDELLPDELVTTLNTRYAIIRSILPREQ
ncbi:MAG TPA: RelA/SpoT domain-containing protein [Solirubrobacteraceae bacterium]|nr:RelA/SpoT domain-containing protein [Solirubrobacteraceae bacterium]